MAEEESPGRTLRGERIGNGSPKGSYLPLGLIAVLAAATGCTTRAAPAEGRVAPWLEDVRIEELKDTDGLDHTYLVTVPCTVELDGS
ncbi:MAG: hypothetical protein GTN78_06850, partial [Gemmatimonadales bacterium]|nr:hypothetical protein [Gemmatimonadales bacterium]